MTLPFTPPSVPRATALRVYDARGLAYNKTLSISEIALEPHRGAQDDGDLGSVHIAVDDAGVVHVAVRTPTDRWISRSVDVRWEPALVHIPDGVGPVAAEVPVSPPVGALPVRIPEHSMRELIAARRCLILPAGISQVRHGADGRTVEFTTAIENEAGEHVFQVAEQVRPDPYGWYETAYWPWERYTGTDATL